MVEEVTRPTWARVLTDARKFGVGLLGALATAAAAGLVPAPYDRWAPVVIALATALGVYAVPNTDAYSRETIVEASVLATGHAYLLGHQHATNGLSRRVAQQTLGFWQASARRTQVHPNAVAPPEDMRPAPGVTVLDTPEPGP
jgi:hypothetical protein